MREFLRQYKKNGHIQGNSHNTTADFSVKLLHVKRKWQDIFELLNRKKLTTKNTLSGKVMIQTKEDINSFPDKS